MFSVDGAITQVFWCILPETLHFSPSTTLIIAAYSPGSLAPYCCWRHCCHWHKPVGALGWQARSLFLRLPSSGALPLLLSSFLRLKSCVSMVLPGSWELRPQTLWLGRRLMGIACSVPFSSVSSMYATSFTFKVATCMDSRVLVFCKCQGTHVELWMF